MDILKSLIIGWSIFWGLLVVAISNLNLSGYGGVFLISQIGKGQPIIRTAFLYGVGIWLSGCVLIILFNWFFKTLWKWIGSFS